MKKYQTLIMFGSELCEFVGLKLHNLLQHTNLSLLKVGLFNQTNEQLPDILNFFVDKLLQLFLSTLNCAV